MSDTDFVLRVLRAFGFGDGGADVCSGLWWRTDNGEVTLTALCSDTFAWATADCEPITPDDVPLLEQCLADLTAIDEAIWLPELFAARKRGMRPMRLVLGTHPNQAEAKCSGMGPGPLRDLFLACGPERDPASEG